MLINEIIDFQAAVGMVCHEPLVKVFVDLENACGGSACVAQHHQRVKQTILDITSQSRIQITYSVGPSAMSTCPDLLWQWNHARFVPGRGLNGADLALLDAIQATRFRGGLDRMVLVSGDHIFAEDLARLQREGIHTTVVSQPMSLSRQLALSAQSIQFLPQMNLSSDERQSA